LFLSADVFREVFKKFSEVLPVHRHFNEEKCREKAKRRTLQRAEFGHMFGVSKEWS
jgi:hypothetical protein